MAAGTHLVLRARGGCGYNTISSAFHGLLHYLHGDAGFLYWGITSNMMYERAQGGDRAAAVSPSSVTSGGLLSWICL